MVRNIISHRNELMKIPCTSTLDNTPGSVQASQDPMTVRSLWAPTAVGAAIAAATASLSRRRARHELAVSGLIGGALGLGCGLVWSSRKVIGSLARGTVRNMNHLQDARWLQRNPINYG